MQGAGRHQFLISSLLEKDGMSLVRWRRIWKHPTAWWNPGCVALSGRLQPLVKHSHRPGSNVFPVSVLATSEETDAPWLGRTGGRRLALFHARCYLLPVIQTMHTFWNPSEPHRHASAGNRMERRVFIPPPSSSSCEPHTLCHALVGELRWSSTPCWEAPHAV